MQKSCSLEWQEYDFQEWKRGKTQVRERGLRICVVGSSWFIELDLGSL